MGRGQQEIDQVVRILKQDGLEEDSDLYCMANMLCKNDINWRFFLSMQTKEGCSIGLGSTGITNKGHETHFNVACLCGLVITP
jgi:hypothetical protein